MTGAIPVGIVRDAAARLAPPASEVIRADDKLVVLSEDHGSAKVAEPASVDAGRIRTAEVCEVLPERILILGWNRRAPAIIRELDRYVAPGSEVLAVSPLEKVEAAGRIDGLPTSPATGRIDNTTQRPALDALDVPSYPHVIVLCESDDRDPDMADARTLVTLLHLRDIEAKPAASSRSCRDARRGRPRARRGHPGRRLHRQLQAPVACSSRRSRRTPTSPTSSATCSTPTGPRSTCATPPTTSSRA